MLEIERKFLISKEDWLGAADGGTPIRQGYLSVGEPTVRVRIKGNKGFITLKSTQSRGVRQEFEYEIPTPDAEAMLSGFSVRPPIKKTRYLVPHQSHLWEVDVFEGANAGLLIAEVELQSINESIQLPDWVGPEVTDDGRFFNAYLTHRPFLTWGVDYQTLLKRQK